ncbi:hypothetical protein [Okeania sp. KiyG1]|uniref:hypothetical protein n=1 Tax=Okeania sp. KiyG1 TaxID=2720165 RepID=UPI00192135E5|nr:hypothetical protein [Okeania sp. KiyG1]GGA26338.1 hypothetical protein CYANOKiyG1_42300 [Okeania sp. KiyG1]
MDIVKQTEKELVFKNRLSYGFAFIFAFPWTGISLLFTLVGLWQIGVIKVSCQRVEPTQVNCQVNNSEYLGLIPYSSTSLTRVAEAKFNSRKSQDSDGDTSFDYFVTLVTQTGEEVVSWQGNSYSNGIHGSPQEMNEMATKINTFINNSTESSLLIQYDLGWKKENLIPLAIGITFLGIGVLLLYASFYLKIITLNKSERQLTYKIYSLLGIKTKHYSFAQIKELILDSYTDSDGDKSCSLELVLPAENQNHQFKIPLILYDSDIEKVKKLANVVANFIDKPYQYLSNK